MAESAFLFCNKKARVETRAEGVSRPKSEEAYWQGTMIGVKRLVVV